MVNKKIKTTVSILLVVVFSVFEVNCQNAENIFDNYYKFGIIGQFNIFKEAHTSSTNNNNLSFDIFKSKVFALGLSYNIFQYKNLNIKAELQLQWFGNNKSIVILEPENIVPFDYIDYSNTEFDKLGYLPVSADYIFFKKGNVAFSIGTGVGLTYYWHYNISGSSGLSINDTILFEAYEINDYPLFYLSNHIQTSTYLTTNSLMLQLSIIYKKSYTSFRQGTYKFTNLKKSPEVIGNFNQNGNFLGVALTFYLKKKTE